MGLTWGLKDGPSGPWTIGWATQISGSLEGKPGSSQVILRHVVARACRFPAAMTGCYGNAGVAATAQTDFLVQKNGVTFVTMRFAALGTVPTWVSGAQTDFAAGDVLAVVAPAGADATLANIAVTLVPALL